MMRRSAVIMCAVLITLIMTGTVSGQTGSNDFFKGERMTTLEHSMYVSGGLDMWLGGEGNLDRSNSVTGSFLVFWNEYSAFRFGMKYNHFLREDDNYIRSLSWDAGVRLMVPYKVISPYVETGFSIYRYYGEIAGYNKGDTKAGVSLALGLSWAFTDNGHIDVTLRKVLNHVKELSMVYSPDGLLPPDDQSFEYAFYCGFGRSANSALYNPTTLEVNYRFGI